MRRILFLICLLVPFRLSAQEEVKEDSVAQIEAQTPLTAKRAKGGIIILGRGRNVRAMSPYKSNRDCLVEYANIANEYYEIFEGTVNVYCMPIPIASEYYGREQTKEWNHSQRPALDKCRSELLEEVTFVDVDPIMKQHVEEPIYARTDHHWMPLGAYYAAQEFARVANVPFKDLSHYKRKVVHDFVGTMYKFSGDISVKNNPEDFVFYVPQGVNYRTTYIDYFLDKARRYVVRETPVREGEFFLDYKDGSGVAYCTFMGGDTKLVKVKTSTHNGRRLLILKDSYGNALPGYLFYSFEEICVVDCRYFTQNIIDYVLDNEITDILFANNIGHAATPRTIEAYKEYLDQ
ncbi:MAG: DHHW family protein [Bacteroidaceae bacterium]|nr:hypothetical protein [Candidatus Minthousia equi]MCQ2247041.1 DHHW family protein [Bacteroidaceae bacterium]MDO4956313.1 DHHW family protein [Bacteroidales bacterium]